MRVFMTLPLIDTLSYAEVELAAAVDAVEAIAPVDADKAEHRHVKTDAEACGIVDFERLKLLHSSPRVTSLKETEDIESGAGTFYDRLAQLEGVAVEHRGAVVGTQAGIFVSAKRNNLATIEDP